MFEGRSGDECVAGAKMETKRLLLWFIATGNKPGAKAIFNSVLLPLQLCLGLWQIAKLTPLWALISCTKSWLIMNLFPGSSYACSDYNQLKKFEGRVFKRVICYVTTPGDLSAVPAGKKADQMYGLQFKRKDSHEKENAALENGDEKYVNDTSRLEINYLGNNFRLELKEIHNKCGGDVLNYYITKEIWSTVLMYLRDVAAEKDVAAKRDLVSEGRVFIKNHKEIWEEVVTGRVMSLEEVLDAVILDGHAVTRMDHEYFLPIDLILTEEKILKVLNLLGLFLQKQKHIHWLVPALLSLTSAVMGFSTTLRRWVYGCVNILSCRAIHLVCDRLCFSTRRQLYSLGNWIENLKPSNDLQSKIVRGDITALIAGAAKVDSDCATLVDFQSETLSEFAASIDRAFEENKKTEPEYSFSCDPFQIECKFEKNKDTEAGNNGRCSLKAGEIASVDVDCSREEAKKLFKFAAYMAQNKSGSLKSYDPNSKTVHVRRFRESVMAYARSGYPELQELKLKNVIVR